MFATQIRCKNATCLLGMPAVLQWLHEPDANSAKQRYYIVGYYRNEQGRLWINIIETAVTECNSSYHNNGSGSSGLLPVADEKATRHLFMCFAVYLLASFQEKTRPFCTSEGANGAPWWRNVVREFAWSDFFSHFIYMPDSYLKSYELERNLPGCFVWFFHDRGLRPESALLGRKKDTNLYRNGIYCLTMPIAIHYIWAYWYVKAPFVYTVKPLLCASCSVRNRAGYTNKQDYHPKHGG